MKRRLSVCVAGLLALLSACRPTTPPVAAKAEAPAKITGATKEVDLASVTLTEKAEQRLGIRVVALVRKTVTRTRTLGGEVVVPIIGRACPFVP